MNIQLQKMIIIDKYIMRPRSHNFFCKKRRFSQSAFHVYQQLESLLLKAAKGEHITLEIESLEASYQEDINIGLLITHI